MVFLWFHDVKNRTAWLLKRAWYLLAIVSFEIGLAALVIYNEICNISLAYACVRWLQYCTTDRLERCSFIMVIIIHLRGWRTSRVRRNQDNLDVRVRRGARHGCCSNEIRGSKSRQHNIIDTMLSTASGYLLLLALGVIRAKNVAADATKNHQEGSICNLT